MYPDYYYDQNYFNYCMREAEKMYPQEYHNIYGHVKRICERDDHPYNQEMQPFPKKEVVDRMIDEVYESLGEVGMYRSPVGYGRPGGILRAFIGALLLRELLDRRRYYPRRRPWFYHY